MVTIDNECGVEFMYSQTEIRKHCRSACNIFDAHNFVANDLRLNTVCFSF